MGDLFLRDSVESTQKRAFMLWSPRFTYRQTTRLGYKLSNVGLFVFRVSVDLDLAAAKFCKSRAVD